MLRVLGEASVDQALDHPGPPERAADDRAATVGLEVRDQSRVAGIALAALLDLGIDVGIGNLDALGIGDLLQDEQRLRALLRVGTEVGVEILARLLDGLEVGLLADA